MSSWYGSLTNRIEERAKSKKPEVGMGATEYCWSDRHAYEIIEVKDDRHILVRQYDAIRTDNNGLSETQTYRFESNEDNPVRLLFLTNKGVWRERWGRKLGSERWGIGHADEYYDPCF